MNMPLGVNHEGAVFPQRPLESAGVTVADGASPIHTPTSSPFHRLEVRIERICMVTPTAIRIRINLTKGMWTTKTAETIIVAHNKEMEKAFTFGGTPFPRS